MKTVIVLCLLSLAAVALGRPEQYTDKYDNINVDEILENRRLLLPYIKCILDQGKCSPEGKELKEHIADALETDCSKCTDKQKENNEKIIKHLVNKEADFWNQISAKYDPESKYSKKYEARFKN